MSARLAEQLLSLEDACQGLLCRVYNLLPTLFRRPASLNDDVAKVVHKLVKHFPSHDDLERVAGIEVFNKRAQTITTELRDYFSTFVDVLSFSQMAWGLLVEISRNIVTFKFELNPDLLRHFFALFTGYAQLHLLVARVDDAKLMLSAYARAHHETHGNAEANFSTLATFIQTYSDDPVRALREKCLAELNVPTLTECLNSFTLIVAKWSDPMLLANKNPMSLLDDAANMDRPKNFQEQLELLYWQDMVHWALYGFLLMPSAIQADEGQLLLMCLRTTFALPVFRDQVLSVHEEYDKVFAYFRVNDWKLKALKKPVLKAAQADYIDTAVNHSKKRNFLRAELPSFCRFFTEFHQLLGPKSLAVLTMLKLARDEIVWYFQNVSYEAYNAKKEYKALEWKDSAIAELLFYADQLQELVLRNVGEIAQYSAGVLSGPDTQNLQPVLQAFLNKTRLPQSVQDLLLGIAAEAKRATAGSDLEKLRLDFYRASILLSSQQSGVKPADMAELNQALTAVMSHSRMVDHIREELVKLCSLKDLFFYRKQLDHALMEALAGADGEGRFCLVFIRLLHQGLYNVHDMCPEEQKSIGPKAVATAEIFFDHVITSLTSLLAGIRERSREHQQQTLPVQIVRQSPYQPGLESLHKNQRHVRALATWKRNLALICEAVRNTDRIVVYNTEFLPREWLYEAVAKTVRNSVLRASMNKQMIKRPSTLLEEVRSIIQAFSCVDRHVNVDLCNILREVLVGDFTDPSTGQAGEPLGLEAPPTKSPLLIQALGSWYISLLSKDLEQMGITFAAPQRGFYSLHRAGEGFRAERYCDARELEALCVLAGPGGVRVINRMLLGLIQARAKEVKRVVNKNMAVLDKLRGHFTEPQYWLETVKNLTEVDTLVREATTIGCALKFRALLRNALREVVSERTPFVFQVVERTLRACGDGHGLRELEELAVDCGLAPGIDDFQLQAALAPMMQSKAERQVWDMLPEVFGACFAKSQVVRGSNYRIQTESHTNNLGCVALCVRALVTVYSTVPPEGGTNAPVGSEAKREAVRVNLRRFIEATSFSVLHMETMKSNFGGYNMPAIVFMEECRGILELSILEDFFPFTLLRTNYIQMHELQIGDGSYAVVDQDSDEYKQQQEPGGAGGAGGG